MLSGSHIGPTEAHAAGLRAYGDASTVVLPRPAADLVASAADQINVWEALHRRHWCSVDRQHATDLVRALAGRLTRPHRILELGCGAGADAVYLASQGHHVTATDFSSVAIRQNRMTHSASGVDFRIQDLRHPLEFAPSFFDLVYARLSLHYFPDDVTRDIVGEVGRVLRPGGEFVFVCKSDRDPLYGQGAQLGPSLFQKDGHLRHFFSKGYARSLVTAELRFEVRKLVRRRARVYGTYSDVVLCVAVRR